MGEVPFFSCYWLKAENAQRFGDGIPKRESKGGIPLAFDLRQFRQGDHGDVPGQAVGFFARVHDP